MAKKSDKIAPTVKVTGEPTDEAGYVIKPGEIVNVEDTGNGHTFAPVAESGDMGNATFAERGPAGPPPDRTGADIVRQLGESKLRREAMCAAWEGNDAEEARTWDALADELGQRAKGQGATRTPVRIAGTIFNLKADRKAGTYSLVEAREPGEIK